MRDPSYPCNKKNKKGWLVEIPTFQLPFGEGNNLYPSPSSPTALGHQVGTEGSLPPAQGLTTAGFCKNVDA